MSADGGRPQIGLDRLKGILDFIQAAEGLKDTLRSGTTSRGRRESTAEHTWRLCLMVMMFGRELSGCDQHRLLKLCIVHDLGEAISGDVPAIHQGLDDGRAARERADLSALCAPLPADLSAEILDLWDEYSAAASPEAIFAKGFDKLETMLQHTIGDNPAGFDYDFNLTYGLQHTDRHPLLREIRSLVDEATRKRAEDQGPPGS
ncbi:HD domain-containing protein [Sinorhizobium sp. BG8]|uniref:HD domain-containing protein n=1 Tax=Sinorhizobium sp. BG8 TaxID=2613773 RepID=UPI00193DE3B3|nr:HD domain-containing protein [Sinorhizobium sp. BG8]QRM53318.1 HD domain-containing protein [Sinorhizobium sp. BG8]